MQFEKTTIDGEMERIERTIQIINGQNNNLPTAQ